MSWLSDFGDQALGVLATVAPGIATALGGPLAGMAVQALASALLPGVEAPSAKQLAAAVNGLPPDQLVRLRQIEAEFAVAMKNADVELDRIAAGDTANARDREKSVRDWAPSVLGFAVITGFMGGLFIMSRYDLPVSNKDYLLVALGYLGASFQNVIGYYFGSSAGSKQKSDILESALRK